MGDLLFFLGCLKEIQVVFQKMPGTWWKRDQALTEWIEGASASTYFDWARMEVSSLVRWLTGLLSSGFFVGMFFLNIFSLFLVGL